MCYQLTIVFFQAHAEQARATMTCIYCMATLQSLPEYNDHISMEHTFNCICNLKFTSKMLLEQHRVSVHGTSIPLLPRYSTPHQCQLCLLSFTTESKMNKHKEMNHKFFCQEEDCDIRFVSRVKLEEHTEHVHNKSLDHSKHKMCLVCGQVRILYNLVNSAFFISEIYKTREPEKAQKETSCVSM